MMKLRTICVMLVLVALGAWADSAKPLLIGWGRADISTTEPVGIRGQMHLRISEGVRDPVTVNALVLDSGDDCVIFLSLDMVGLRSFLVREIRDEVKKLAPDIPVDKILMSVTHTHSGGDVYGDDPDEFPCDVPHMAGLDYSSFVARQSAQAIVEAWKERAPGGIAWGYGYATTGHQRRPVYSEDKGGGTVGFAANGHAVMYGNTNDPTFSHFEAGADTFIHFVFTFDPAGKLTGALINVPVPSQNSEMISELSADFWHEVRTLLRAEYGDIGILPQCAAAGDLAPRILHNKLAQERRFQLKYGDIALDMAERRDIAERIAVSFREVLEWAKKDIRTAVPLQHKVETVELPRQRISPEQYEEEKANLAMFEQQTWATEGSALDRLMLDSSLASLRGRCRAIVKRFEAQDSDPVLPMELHAVGIGELAWVSNRFELYADFMHRIQARSPFAQTLVVQLAGSGVGESGGGYLPTERAEANKGYGAIPYSCLVGHEGGAVLVEKSLEALRQALPADGTIRLGLFEGSPYGVMKYDYHCEARQCTGVMAQANGAASMTANFAVSAELAANARTLVMEGQACDKADIPPAPIRLTLNGRVIFEDSCGFTKNGWSVREFAIPSGVLKAGSNILTVENRSEANHPTGGWVLISSVALSE